MELSHWRELVQQRLEQKHQRIFLIIGDLCLGERIKQEGDNLKNIKDFSLEVIILGMIFQLLYSKEIIRW